MTNIPRSALILGLAGLIPFVWGGLTMLSPEIGAWGQRVLGARFVGPYVSLAYGQIILAFMSGVLWGFATKATGQIAATGYGLSVIPALWAFLMVGSGPVSAAMNLLIGFIALLALDWLFWKEGLAPKWWMSLRVGLTSIVLLSLLPILL